MCQSWLKNNEPLIEVEPINICTVYYEYRKTCHNASVPVRVVPKKIGTTEEEFKMFENMVHKKIIYKSTFHKYWNKFSFNY